MRKQEQLACTWQGIMPPTWDRVSTTVYTKYIYYTHTKKPYRKKIQRPRLKMKCCCTYKYRAWGEHKDYYVMSNNKNKKSKQKQHKYNNNNKQLKCKQQRTCYYQYP